ncbi:plasma membrane SNARE protein (Sec9), putative [Talaromyces stipitatus ATCC 10500]|uniref:Protein transport protein SEC9 n=1 Tax=Talaromyces stipitatus (strain ATCC 10500 / CBS 375.48 / QM 6759 / NRRL 1006) TaxID=441959 RepID=B8MQP7_TALSN|nr:plasma membrane SNARE protein (Sec9), putative [Talaromyces stipitatus ATCC 10500]EED13470.1 plasma membrane SNARE protein (Sec9), putative [Talaromyces stipitatus ATCC 10500]
MKKFGFKKSKDDGDDDSNRRALFGSRSRDKSPNPQAQGSNPYAQNIPIDPYTRAKINAGVAPAPGGTGPAGQGYSDVKHPDGPVGNQQGGYAPNRYGNQGGYGADRYGGGADNSSRPGGGPRPGGYGGLGSTDPNEADRDALFGGARDRVQQNGPGGPPPPYSTGGPGAGGYGGYGEENGGSSAVYQERQLTAEEEEEEEVNAVKQEIRFIKQGDVSSTRNALRAAAQAEETGRNTLARLGAQSERILDTEKSLDVAASQGRLAEEKARELKTLNKSMFAMHVSNPFTSNARRRERDEKLLETHRAERNTREGTRQEAFQSNQRMERTFREIEREANKNYPAQKKDLAERAKYQFEADSEDEAMEDEIDNNLNLLSGAAARLNGLAKATGKELEEQNRHLDRIMGKSDYVDDQIAMNRARLDRIR